MEWSVRLSSSIFITASPPFSCRERRKLQIFAPVSATTSVTAAMVPGAFTVKDNERRVLAGNEDIHAVYLGDENIAAADAAAPEGWLMAGGIGKGDARGIRMSPLDLAGGNPHLESRIGSQFWGKTNPFIVRFHSHDAGNQRLVGTVTPVSFGKGTVEQDIGPERAGAP